MPSTTRPSPLFTTHLQAAESVWECIPRGAELVVLRGAICVHQRQMLAESWIDVPVHLQAGERFRVPYGGWLELEAYGTASVAVWPALSGWLWLGSGVRDLVRRWVLRPGRQQ